MKTVLLFAIRCYQAVISPLLGCNCRFVPTCSEYARDAIHTHGVLRGISLTVKRVLSCQPFSKAGF